MAITENKVITTYTANVEQEKRALDDLMRKIDQLRATETRAANSREQHFDSLVLDLTRSNQAADDGAMKWDGWGQKGESAFSKFSGGMKRVGAAMTPLNQALELGGKVVAFASEGMEAYAKTSAAAAEEVKKLNAEFQGYKDAVMAGVGEMTVALLRSSTTTQKWAEQYLSDLQNGQKAFLGGFARGRDNRSFFGELNADPMGNLTNTLDAVKTSILGTADAWDGRGKKFLEDLAKGFDDVSKKGSKAAEEAAKLRAQLGAYQTLRSATMYYDFDAPNIKRGKGVTGGLGEAADSTYRDQSGLAVDEQKLLEQITAGMDLRSVDKQYSDFNARKSESKLAAMFGPIEEFNVYAEAFNMLGGAVSSAMDAWITGSMSAGQAIKKFLADALKGLASQMAIEALKHGAYAIGSIAMGNPVGAATHSAAAAAFAGGAAAAAVAARALGGGGGSAPTDHRSTGGGRGDGGTVNSNRTRGGGSDSSRPIVMVVGSAFDDMSPRQRAIKAQEAFDKARRARDEN